MDSDWPAVNKPGYPAGTGGSMNPSDKEALRRHLESLGLYGRDLKYKDVEKLVDALNRSGERALADQIVKLDHFTTVSEFLRRYVG